MRRLRILITVGPTREYIDSVRFLSNASSGRMGFALARAAARRGHVVTLVTGPVDLPAPRGVQTIHVVSAAQMAAQARRAFARCDGAIFTAAVSDYRPVRRAARKIPKSSKRWSLSLKPTPDIAATLGRIKGRRWTVCFALEDRSARPNAARKMRRKAADAVVLNGPRNIGSDSVDIQWLVGGGRWQRWPRMPKSSAAARLIREIEALSRNLRGHPALSRLK